MSLSRASKGRGLDHFFPTAPSVIQQKRSRAAQQRRKLQSPPAGRLGSHCAASESQETAVEDVDFSGGTPVNRAESEEAKVEPAVVAQDEGDSVQGDLLNAVGSASSSSTASSVFSTHHRNLAILQHGTTHSSYTPTPLTVADSSPPRVHKSPPQTKRDALAGMDSGLSVRTPDSNHKAPTPEFDLTPISSPGPEGLQARPGKGEVKGIKVTYDPDTDKKLDSKERKKLKVKWHTFGEEVRYFPASFLVCVEIVVRT